MIYNFTSTAFPETLSIPLLFNGSIPTRFLMICYNFVFHQSQIHYQLLPQTNPQLLIRFLQLNFFIKTFKLTHKNLLIKANATKGKGNMYGRPNVKPYYIKLCGISNGLSLVQKFALQKKKKKTRLVKRILTLIFLCIISFLMFAKRIYSASALISSKIA